MENYVRHIGYLFTYAGLWAAIVQGVIGKLVKKFGEQKLIFVSLIIFAIGLAGLPFAKNIWEILVVLTILAIGSGLNRPPVFGLISLSSSPHEQGANLGVAQSFGSLARILGPIFASTLFFVNAKVPYVICGGIALLTAIFAWKFLSRDISHAAAATKN